MDGRRVSRGPQPSETTGSGIIASVRLRFRKFTNRGILLQLHFTEIGPTLYGGLVNIFLLLLLLLLQLPDTVSSSLTLFMVDQIWLLPGVGGLNSTRLHLMQAHCLAFPLAGRDYQIKGKSDGAYPHQEQARGQTLLMSGGGRRWKTQLEMSGRRNPFFPLKCSEFSVINFQGRLGTEKKTLNEEMLSLLRVMRVLQI